MGRDFDMNSALMHWVFPMYGNKKGLPFASTSNFEEIRHFLMFSLRLLTVSSSAWRFRANCPAATFTAKDVRNLTVQLSHSENYCYGYFCYPIIFVRVSEAGGVSVPLQVLHVNWFLSFARVATLFQRVPRLKLYVFARTLSFSRG